MITYIEDEKLELKVSYTMYVPLTFSGKTITTAQIPITITSALNAKATCTTDGLEYRICSRCKNEETRKLDALGHDFSKDWTVDTEATCTVDGSKSHHCSRCEEKSDVKS